MMTFRERAYKASGSFEADRMFLVVEGACALLEASEIVYFIQVEIQGMFQKALQMPHFAWGSKLW
eukprot:1139996-Pelagomonas_calceolata.AAC.1